MEAHKEIEKSSTDYPVCRSVDVNVGKLKRKEAETNCGR